MKKFCQDDRCARVRVFVPEYESQLDDRNMQTITNHETQEYMYIISTYKKVQSSNGT